MSAIGGPSINYHKGKSSHIVLVDPSSSMLPNITDVSSVVDTVSIKGKTITFTATRLSVTAVKMKIQLQGQGLPAGVKLNGSTLDAGNLTITLSNPSGSPSPPKVDNMPVDYVDNANS
jgi:hypothetical protein